MSENANIVVRAANSQDKDFIFSTWLKGNYFGCPYFRRIPQDVYYKEYAGRISKTLMTQGMNAVIACDENNPDWIVGFAIFKEPALYWVHVKKDFRNKGIASLLLKNRTITEVKATTKVGQAISEAKNLIFNPFT